MHSINIAMSHAGAAHEVKQAAEQYINAHPAVEATRRFGTFANVVGIPSALSSLPLLVDGVTRIHEAPTPSQTVIGAAEVAGSMILYGGAALLERIRSRRANRAVRQAITEFTGIVAGAATLPPVGSPLFGSWKRDQAARRSSQTPYLDGKVTSKRDTVY